MMKEQLYFGAHRMIGSSLGRVYRKYKREDAQGVPEDTPDKLLARLLRHCEQQVPYYAARMAAVDLSYREDPAAYLERLPILTKDLIRTHFEALKSRDLDRRAWSYNSSGGSTGMPVKLIQDRDYLDHQSAIQLLSHDWAGRRFGERAVRIWGSDRDIVQGSMGFKMKLLNRLTNDTYLNAFRMGPEQMRSFITELNSQPPQLIIAYAQAAYELAQFAEREGLRIVPQRAMLTSAGTLYPAMREKIEGVFGCKIFDRYGSREVGDIACECAEHCGLHLFPWGSYVEIVDDDGQPVPDGTEGNILVTSLNNYAMPLIRYRIGDRGVLSIRRGCPCGRRGRILERITGRSQDTFRRADGTLVNTGYFVLGLFNREWIDKFQVIQNDYRSIVYRIVPTGAGYRPEDLVEITRRTQLAMGADCQVDFEFPDDIASSPSGKYRYTISHVPAAHSSPAG
jgi:phenylacetate-CoA ligase